MLECRIEHLNYISKNYVTKIINGCCMLGNYIKLPLFGRFVEYILVVKCLFLPTPNLLKVAEDIVACVI